MAQLALLARATLALAPPISSRPPTPLKRSPLPTIPNPPPAACSLPTSFFAPRCTPRASPQVRGGHWKAVPRGGAIWAASGAELSEQVSGHSNSPGVLETGVGLGSLTALVCAFNRAARHLAPSVTAVLPGAVPGALALWGVLWATDAASPPTAGAIVGYLDGGVCFLERWLPLFYTAALVTLPAVVRSGGLVAGDAVRVGLTLAGALVASVSVTGLLASLLRTRVQTRLGDAQHMPPCPPYRLQELVISAAALAGSALLYLVAPTALGDPATTALPFMITATTTSYLTATLLAPGALKQIIHPTFLAAALSNVVLYVMGQLSNRSWSQMLSRYMAGGSRLPSAPGILAMFLGPAIMSSAVLLYRQRNLIRRHFLELAVSIPIAAYASLYFTLLVARALNLTAGMSLSLVPRSVAPAFAPALSRTLGGDPAVGVATAVLTGMLGSYLVLPLLSVLRVRDPLARALATATSCHGVGSASLMSEEGELVPLCSVVSTLTAITTSLLAAYLVASGRL